MNLHIEINQGNRRLVAAFGYALFSFFIAQAAVANDQESQDVVCGIEKCSDGFQLDTKNCQCFSLKKPEPEPTKICMAVTRCMEGQYVDPKTCRCK